MTKRDGSVWAQLSKDLTWDWRVTETHNDSLEMDEWTIEGTDPKDGRRYFCRRCLTHEAEILHGTNRTHQDVLFALYDMARHFEVEGSKPFELRVAEALMED